MSLLPERVLSLPARVVRPMCLSIESATLARHELARSVGGNRVDPIDRWYVQFTSTPVGSLILFLAVFVARLSLEQWHLRRKATKLHKRPKGG